MPLAKAIGGYTRDAAVMEQRDASDPVGVVLARVDARTISGVNDAIRRAPRREPGGAADTMKSGKTHRIPLSTQALDVLRQARD